MWFQYPERTGKAVAYIVHANWMKWTKKAKLLRDNLWFLTADDGQCAAGFDPMREGCDRLCRPVLDEHCELGRRCDFRNATHCERLRRDVEKERASKRTATFGYGYGPTAWRPMALAEAGCQWPRS